MSPVSPPSAAIGYYWGDDGYGVEHAADALGSRIAAETGGPLERRRLSGDQTSATEIGETVATQTLFGGGTLVVVSNPIPLVRSKDGREALAAVLGSVAPGNALSFVDPMERPPKILDAGRAWLAEAVKAAGGEVRYFAAPREGRMAAWIEERAQERAIRLGRGAAQTLAELVGAFVREGDVDRRRQGALAVGELEKLALFRPGGEIRPDDVRALVPHAVPASAWAFLDAVGSRKVVAAEASLDPLLEAIPEPVLLVQVHRRIRELIEVLDRLSSGEPAESLPRSMKLHPERARILSRQAVGWTLAELEVALEGLLELDVAFKNADGAGRTDRQRRLAWALWVAGRVGRERA